jgi:hypothetical protein
VVAGGSLLAARVTEQLAVRSVGVRRVTLDVPAEDLRESLDGVESLGGGDVGTGDDIARSVLFLASPDAACREGASHGRVFGITGLLGRPLGGAMYTVLARNGGCASWGLDPHWLGLRYGRL